MSGEDAERMEEIFECQEAARRADAENIRQRAAFQSLLTNQGLIVALPSGSLQEPTEQCFTKARFRLKKVHPRSIEAELKGLAGVTKAIYVKPNQIPHFVAQGFAAFGITAEDCVGEFSTYNEREETSFERFKKYAELQYSRRTSGPTRGVFIAKQDNPVNSISEIGAGERIASEYRVATAKALAKHRVKASILECTGGAESLVVSGMCRYAVALVETGDTLHTNGLKVIGELFSSNTLLIANNAALDIPAVQKIANFFARKLTGVLAARDKVYLVMNAPADKVGAIRDCLQKHHSALREPTVSPLFNGKMYCSIASVVWADMLNVIEMELSALGADGFVELDAACIM